MHTSRSVTTLETKPSTKPYWNQPPADALENCAKFLSSIKDQAALSLVSKHYHEIISRPEHSKFGFFSLHYSLPDKSFYQLILNTSQLTAPHVRAGNQLVLDAIAKLKNGAPSEADRLIYRAMHRHGSALAMQFVKMFSVLPGQCKLPYDIDKLIEAYAAQAEQALEKEYKPYYSSASMRDRIKQDLRSARGQLELQITNSISAYQACYSLQNLNFSKKFNSHLIEASRGDMFEHEFKPLALKTFDAEGFIGSEKPKQDTAWYLQTDAQKEFQKLQEIIGNSFNESKEEQPRKLLLL